MKNKIQDKDKNKNKYMENKDIKFLNKNMQKLLRLKQTTTKYQF